MRPVTPLKIAIVTSGMTVAEVAERSGVSHRTITRLARAGENPTSPSPLTRRALADALGKPAEELWPESVAA